MLVVRAATPADLDALYALAQAAGPGMTTFKADRAALAQRLDLAAASFRQTIAPAQRDYVFVLEDTGNGRVAGIAAIKASVGLDEPFFNFRLGAMVHAAQSVGVYARHQVLYLSHDLTGCAELCSLFLDPAYRGGGNGRLLSQSRLLFIAQFPQLFPQPVFAEMRGYQDGRGTSPFWESLGRKFFDMDFHRADDLCQPGAKSYIAELMPRYPIYTTFLTDAARAAIGRTHADTTPARRLLEREGFTTSQYIDIFDGGPVLQADVAALRATRDSVLVIADNAVGEQAATAPALLCTTNLAEFRAIAAAAAAAPDRAILTPAAKNALQCDSACTIRVLGLQ